MIQATELMIGDLVQLTISHKPVIINGITYDSKIAKKHLIHFFFVNDGDARWNYSPESFEPIPLTPEILEKNGFEKSECGCYYGCYYNRKIDEWEIEIYIGRIETFVKINKGVFPHINNTDCHFLHQLQHALRLCGIEKEIVL